jgi:hypothetical protein
MKPSPVCTATLATTRDARDVERSRTHAAAASATACAPTSTGQTVASKRPSTILRRCDFQYYYKVANDAIRHYHGCLARDAIIMALCSAPPLAYEASTPTYPPSAFLQHFQSAISRLFGSPPCHGRPHAAPGTSTPRLPGQLPVGKEPASSPPAHTSTKYYISIQISIASCSRLPTPER